MFGFLVLIALAAGGFFFFKSKLKSSSDRSSRREALSTEGRSPNLVFEGWLSTNAQLMGDKDNRSGVKFALGIFNAEREVQLVWEGDKVNNEYRLKFDEIKSVSTVQSTPSEQYYLWYDIVGLHIEADKFPWDQIYLATFDDSRVKALYEALAKVAP